MGELTRESLIEAARQAAQRLGGVLSRADFERETGISEHHIYRLFPDGGWLELQRRAGLVEHPKYHKAMPDDDLLAEFHRVACLFGSIPPWPRFGTEARVSADVIRRRFGGRRGTLFRYKAWLEEHAADSGLLPAVREEVEACSKHLPPRPPSAPRSSSVKEWPRTSDAEYGAPIDFRGLRHAPINEQGVIYLFALVAADLGFLVEAIGASFPDCEAKRCVNRRQNRWQRVYIEFEFRSRNFLEHGHDAAKCHIIVCWEHDWPECPLEVIELRRVVRTLVDKAE